MKSSITKLGILLIALASLFVLSSGAGSNQDAPRQVLLVETYLMANKEAGLYIFHRDKPTEWHDLGLLSQKNIETNGRLITNKLQELYDAGWKLEGMVGGDQYQRYVLTKD